MARAPRPRRSLIAVGASGLLLFATLLLGGSVAVPHDSTGEQVRRYLERNMDALGLQVLGATLGFAAVLALLVALRSAIRVASPDRSESGHVWVDVATVGGVLTALWFWVTAALDMIPLVAADEAGKLNEYNDATLLGLDLFGRLGETFGDVATVPRGMFVLAVSMLLIRTRLVPRWVGHLGLVVAAASLVSVLGMGWDVVALSIAWFVGLFGFVLWLLCLALSALVRGLRRDPETTTVG